VRCQAAIDLRLCGGASEDLDALARALRGPDPDVQRAAAYGLGGMGEPVTPVLLELLRANAVSPSLRAEAAQQLVDLTAALGDAHAEVCFWAAYALGESREERALEPLAGLTGDEAVVPEWWSAGREAAWAIATIRGGREAPQGD
jgi:HEAT repeat protein